MPKKPMKPCGNNACPQLVKAGERFCPKHKRSERKRYDQERGNFRQRGYDSRWDKARKMFLQQNPLCSCGQAATLAHHKVPVSKRPDLLLDFTNLASMCRACHEEVHKAERWKGSKA